MFKTGTTYIKIFILGFLILFLFPKIIYAQTVDPSVWQTGATGLKLTKDVLGNKKTAGLSFWVTDQGWPFLSTAGGVEYTGYAPANISGPVGIQFGQILIPNVSSSAVTSESADWSNDHLTYNGGSANQLDIWSSRLSPSTLIQRTVSGSGTLRYFAGNVMYYNNYDTDPQHRALVTAPSSLKWIAYSTGGSIKVQQLPTSGSTALSLPTLDSNWILVWYGTNSHFRDTRVPILYPFPSQVGCCSGGSSTDSDTYQADVPLLMVFDKAPTAIIDSPNGGVDLTYGNGSNYTSILPLYGRNHIQASTTDSWGSSTTLPQDAITKINFWVTHLCSFPQSVSESFGYNNSADTSTVTENFSYTPVCSNGSGGTQYALIPPMLGVTYNQGNPLNISFSGTVVNGNLPSDAGPILGIENTNTYSYTISGLNKYINYSQSVTSPPLTTPPSNITSMLNSEVDKITSAGHYSPWFVPGKTTRNMDIGDLYFDNPADTIIILSQIIPVLSDPEKTNLLNYLKTERSSYPPESIYNLTVGQGATRGNYMPPDDPSYPGGDFYTKMLATQRPNLFLPRVPLYNFYALSDYYSVAGGTPPSSLLSTLQTTLNSDMSNMDWANLYWFSGFDIERTAVENMNRHMAGLIGAVRIFQSLSDTTDSQLSRSLFAKAVVSRIAMASYTQYLYSSTNSLPSDSTMVSLPSDSAWAPKLTANSLDWIGNLYNYSWAKSSDDARQVTTLDQFQTILFDSSGFNQTYVGYGSVPGTSASEQHNGSTYAYLTAFKHIVPETAQVLKDFAKSSVDIYTNKYISLLPQWYAAFTDDPLGDEHGFSYPIDSYEIFLAKDWIDQDTPVNLSNHVDIPWLTSGGDLFYVQKLAETIRSYDNTTSAALPPAVVTPGPQSSPVPTASPTPTNLSPTLSPTPPIGGGSITPTLTPTPTGVVSGLNIAGITDNASSYPGNQIPNFEKYELSFQVNNSLATNFQLPYDPAPPAGVPLNLGISVNALFLPPGQSDWSKASTQPAFYYQNFTYQVVNNNTQDWFYPTSNYSWKVRFSPNQIGNWQYKLTAQDSSGTYTSPVQSFTVTSSSNHGFVQVSKNDSRYFEFNDGTFFPGLGFNMNFNQISWDNPILGNQANFQAMGQDGVQLTRMWLSQWSIFGSQAGPWQSPYRGSNYMSLADADPTSGAVIKPGSNASMQILYSHDNSWQGSDCMFLGYLSDPPPVKLNTSYHITITYDMPQGLTGPNIPTDPANGQPLPYGFVAKIGNWLTGTKTVAGTSWRSQQECAYPSTLANEANSWSATPVQPITQYVTTASNGWTTLTGDFTTNSTNTIDGGNYLNYLYLALENVTGNTATPQGDAGVWIDSVSIQENLGNGQYGPNIITSNSADDISNYSQSLSNKFDQVVNLAHQNNIYFKLVGLEKNEWIQNSYDFNGNPQNAATSINNNDDQYFYGNFRTMDKIRWYQQAYWRYLQARWGYSTNIHSWELLNEGDPWNGAHYALADEFGKYMHQFGPDTHLVTTSTWNSWPLSGFWNNSSYPNLDYADVHQYTPSTGSTTLDVNGNSIPLYSPSAYNDTASNTQILSNLIGAKQQYGANKPVIRGEAGFFDSINTNDATPDFAPDTQGIWLHNFIWGEINPGGLYEQYWYDYEHLNCKPGEGIVNTTFCPTNYYPTGAFDRRPLYLPFYSFISGIPLNNGHYQDAAATVSDSVNLRAWGQKDTTNGHAHLWIQNVNHTWNNVVNNVAITPISGTVTIPAMQAGPYTVSWFDTYAGNVTSTQNITVNNTGNLTLTLPQPLSTDIAVKIDTQNASSCAITSATWSTNGPVVAGTPVTLTVNGNNCANQTVNFTVTLDQGIIYGTTVISSVPVSAVFNNNNIATTVWNTVYTPACVTLGISLCNTSYYFTATSGSSSISSSTSSELQVTQTGGNPTPTPTPTSIPTLSPTPTATPVLSPTPIINSTGLNSGIVSYYKFDEDTGSTVSDSVSGDNGTWQGTLGSQWTTGEINSAGNFNGTDNKVTLSSSPDTTTGDISISAWINFPKVTNVITGNNTNNLWIISGTKNQGSNTITEGIGAIVGGPNHGYTGWEFNVPYNNSGNAGTAIVSSSSTINPNTWYHIVGVVSGSTLSLYVNGSLVGTNTVSNRLSANTSWNIYNLQLCCGAANSGAPAIIDEIGFWNRALSSSEVTTLYNSGSGVQYPFGGTTTPVPTTYLSQTGDVNGDGVTNFVDLSIQLTNFNQTVPHNTEGDLNGDGFVNSPDFSMMVTFLQQAGIIQ